MSFIKHNVYLTDFQLNKMRLAAKKKVPVHLDINPNQKSNFELYLTQRQITKLNKGKNARIKLSKSQLGQKWRLYFHNSGSTGWNQHNCRGDKCCISCRKGCQC